MNDSMTSEISTENVEYGEAIIEIARRLHAQHMLAAGDGNISLRLKNDMILITPTGVSKAFMNPEDMAILTLEGEVIKGSPSSESAMHLEVYRKCEKAQSVVHAHPPHVIAWTVAAPELKALPDRSLSEIILACGAIPFVPYARPGTESMGGHLRPYLPEHRVLVLRHHGALTWGESLDEAYFAMERLEHSARVLYLAKTLGTLSELPADEVEVLREMRSQMGETVR